MSQEEALSQCVSLINQAQMSTKEEKSRCLLEVQELSLHQHPELLPQVLSHISDFQADQHSDIRKFVSNFIREAFKKCPETLPQAVPVLHYLLNDSNGAVVKRVLLAASDLFPRCIAWICANPTTTESLWTQISEMKDQGFALLDRDNDSVRTHAIKLCTAAVLALSSAQPPASNEPAQTNLLNVPEGHPILDRAALAADGERLIEELSNRLQSSKKLTKTSLPVLLNDLNTVMKQRPQFIPSVLPAMISAAKSCSKQQDKSLSENFKRIFSGVANLPSAEPWYNEIGQRLFQFGARKEAAEMMKRGKKRKPEGPPEATPPVRVQRMERDPRGGRGDPRASRAGQPRDENESGDWPKELFELFEEWQRKCAWEPAQVAERVLSNLQHIPPLRPEPSPAITPSREQIAAAMLPLSELYQKIQNAGGELAPVPAPTPAPASAKPEPVEQEPQEEAAPEDMALVPTNEAVEASVEPGSGSLKRLLEKTGPRAAATIKKACGARAARAASALLNVLTTRLTGLFDAGHADVVSAAVASGSADLALQYLHREFALEQCNGLLRYSASFKAVFAAACAEFLNATEEESVATAAARFRQLLTYAPVLNYPDFLPTLQETFLRWCPVDTDAEAHPEYVMAVLNELHAVMQLRPHSCDSLLDFCLSLASHPASALRNAATEFLVSIFSGAAQPTIANFALEQLKTLSHAAAEDDAKHRLALFFELCVKDTRMLTEAVVLYPSLSEGVQGELKQALGSMLEQLDSDASEQLHELVGEFDLLFTESPAPLDLGLVLINKLCDKAVDGVIPSTLIDAVLQLHSSLDDPRLMAEIFRFLEKDDALYQLPVILCLPEAQMQAALSGLLSNKRVTPVDLLVDLHTIDPEDDNTALTQLGEPKLRLRKVIEATSYCFSAQDIFTHTVFATVIQRLLSQSPLPKLFMRTVIQTVTHFPQLSEEFVFEELLSNLITKEIWKDVSQWKGFIKCCELLKQRSAPVLLQLPLAQFKALFLDSTVDQGLKDGIYGFVCSDDGRKTPKEYVDIIQASSS